jgi:MFS transporter, DHA1 family, tetracycline resistance protein
MVEAKSAEAAKPADGHSRNSLGIVFVTVFIDLLGFAIVLPLLPRYGEYFHANGAVLGLLMASFSAMQFIFSPIWGRVSDHVGRRPILILGLAGSTASYAVFGIASSLEAGSRMLGLAPLTWLFIARIGAGIAGATISTAQAYIADKTSPQQRARGMALIGAAFGIGFTFGPLIGAACVSSDPTAPPSPAAGYVASALSGIALIWAITMLPESLRPGSTPSRGGWFLLSNLRVAIERPSIGLILTSMFFTTFAFAQFETTLALLTKTLGLPDRSNFFVFAYIGAILTISQGLIVRRLVTRVGEYRMSLAGTGLMAVGLVGVAWAAHQESLPILYSVIPVCVLGFAAVTPSLQSLLSRRSDASEQGGILGVGQGIAAIARIFGPVAGLTLLQHSLTLPYWCGAGVMALSVFLVSALRSSPPIDEAAFAQTGASE